MRTSRTGRTRTDAIVVHTLRHGAGSRHGVWRRRTDLKRTWAILATRADVAPRQDLVTWSTPFSAHDTSQHHSSSHCRAQRAARHRDPASARVRRKRPSSVQGKRARMSTRTCAPRRAVISAVTASPSARPLRAGASERCWREVRQWRPARCLQAHASCNAQPTRAQSRSSCVVRMPACIGVGRRVCRCNVLDLKR